MLTRHLDIDMTMHDDGYYEIIVSEPETGYFTEIDKRNMENLYQNDDDLSEILEEVKSWLITMDEEKKDL